MTMTPAAERLRGHLAAVYGDRRKAALLRERADALDRLQADSDEASRLLHESALLGAKLRARRDHGKALLAIPSLTPEQAERFRARITAAVRADRDNR
jgi:hypothetical protein